MKETNQCVNGTALFRWCSTNRPVTPALGKKANKNKLRKGAQMNNEIDENAKLDVEISNLRATEDEVEKLKAMITEKFDRKITNPAITLDRVDSKGAPVYEVNFKVLDPKNFKIETIQEFLYSLSLVGWRVEGTFVKE
ncbi:hypothetical protein QQM79_16175 [Marinobacteraceae bacterium S3BR75-40.1]